MKNLKHIFVIMAIVAIAIFSLASCGGSGGDTPVEQSITFDVTVYDESIHKTVTIYFTALPGVTPDWLIKDGVEGTLLTAVKGMGPFMPTVGDHTLTVTTEGTDGFTLGADGKVTVSEAFVKNSDFDTMDEGLFNVVSKWTAMIEQNVQKTIWLG